MSLLTRTMEQMYRERVQYLLVTWEVFEHWHRVGAAQGLSSHSDIASFLLQHYESSWIQIQAAGRCASCGTPFPSFCSACQQDDPQQQKHQQQNHEDHANPLLDPYVTNSDILHQAITASGALSLKVPEYPKFVSIPSIDNTVAVKADVSIKDETLQDTEELADPAVDPTDMSNRPDLRCGVSEVSDDGKAESRMIERTSDGAVDSVNLHMDSKQASIENKEVQSKVAVSSTRKFPLPLGDKKFLCPQCGSAFAQSGSLTRHMRKHTGERPFVCKECGADFSCKGVLIVHMRKHSGEKPYLCQECGSAYSQASNLTTHMRTHSGEKPYKCEQCSCCFSTSSSLTRHIRTHTGEKPYKCHECGAAFPQSGNLKEHMQKHTGIKPFKCNLCGAGFSTSTRLRRHQRHVKCTQ